MSNLANSEDQDKMGLDARKPVFGGLRTTQEHPHRLISAFVIHLSRLATS